MLPEYAAKAQAVMARAEMLSAYQIVLGKQIDQCSSKLTELLQLQQQTPESLQQLLACQQESNRLVRCHQRLNADVADLRKWWEQVQDENAAVEEVMRIMGGKDERR